MFSFTFWMPRTGLNLFLTSNGIVLKKCIMNSWPRNLAKFISESLEVNPHSASAHPELFPPTIVTSWLLQASWPAQSLPHSPPILGSVPYMSNVWHPIQWVTRPGLTFRTKCQSLWKMQTGRQRVAPCSQVLSLFLSAYYQQFHWEVLPGKWSGPELPAAGPLLSLPLPATHPGEKAEATVAGNGPPSWVGSEGGVGNHLCGFPVHLLDKLGISSPFLHELTVNSFFTDFPIFK